MAVVDYTRSTIRKNTIEVRWVGNTIDTFTPFVIKGQSPRNIMVQSEGGTATVLGSLYRDAASVNGLRDHQGVAVSLADGGMSEVIDRPFSIYPVPVGTGATFILTISY